MPQCKECSRDKVCEHNRWRTKSRSHWQVYHCTLVATSSCSWAAGARVVIRARTGPRDGAGTSAGGNPGYSRHRAPSLRALRALDSSSILSEKRPPVLDAFLNFDTGQATGKPT